MERDFLGLSTMIGSATKKEDAADIAIDAVTGSGMQWSFSNKFLLFLNCCPSRLVRKTGTRKTTSSADTFDSNLKPFLGGIQKSLSMGKQVGNERGMTVYPMQQVDNISGYPQEARTFSVSNQSNQRSPVLQSTVSTTVPLIAPVPVLPANGSVVGTTDLRNSSKTSGKPTQLTIFYAGSVCVYENISPEKAQAIMLLAGNGSTPNHTKPVSTAPVQTPNSKPAQDDRFIVSQSYHSALPSPIPMTFHASPQPGGGSPSTNEPAIVRPVASSSAAPSSHLESPSVAGSAKSASTKMGSPVDLPQARKASLARFLEKRKERVTSTSPYSMNKKSPECGTPGTDSIGFSITSGSCSLPAMN
ncbi:protein TIFY 6B-like isoform X1 [Prosopis cineraria]|uniref:protein TIFY 6B-like isoform X1 n=1 Tax=Prosopis cineraria TaxID=364024 RepID=UPI002410AC74|nr:protein TIFY 6B-like isoform X1 [Prosopis cineraria]